MTTTLRRTAVLLLTIAMLHAGAAPARAASAAEMTSSARAALADLYRRTPAARTLGNSARGILVFPSITKGGFIFGAEFGNGVLFRRGRTSGYYNTSGVSYGFQAGLQQYGYALFFMTDTALRYLNESKGFELGGYVPEAIVYHHIPAERMTVEYFRRRMANEGACDMYTRFHQEMPGQLGLLWHAISIMLRNSPLWLVEPLVTGRPDWLSLRVQLQTVRSRAQLQYVFRLMRDKDFRQFVLKKDWLNNSCTSQ